MIVDDTFLTLGSANISFASLEFHSEMNVVINDPTIVSATRRRLWKEHLQFQTIDEKIFSDPRTGFGLWKLHAEKNVADLLARSKPLSRVYPFPCDYLDTLKVTYV